MSTPISISVFSLWRNSESYIQRTLLALQAIEKATPSVEFSYFFYENDSTDDTANILKQWGKNRKFQLLSEKVNFPQEGSVYTSSRMYKMTYYRNRMINQGRMINTNYSVVFDSDIIFPENIINQFLSKVDEETVMYIPNVLQNIKCKWCNCGKDSYYDVAALFDLSGQQALHWSCNPFLNVFDRQKYFLGQPVEVKSGFGGFAFFKSFPLNFCNWNTQGQCEHLPFCEDLKKFGKIKLYSDIIVKTELSPELITKYGP